MRRKSAPGGSGGCSLSIGRQAKGADDALKIVTPIKFNFNPAAFFAVMNRDVGREVLLQTILEILRAVGLTVSACLRRRVPPSLPS